MTVFSLCKAGYGSVEEIRKWGTKEFLDAVEFENINSDIHHYLLNKKA